MITHRPFDLVGTDRLELLTSCMSSRRSNQLGYAPEAFSVYNIKKYNATIFRLFYFFYDFFYFPNKMIDNRVAVC